MQYSEQGNKHEESPNPATEKKKKKKARRRQSLCDGGLWKCLENEMFCPAN